VLGQFEGTYVVAETDDGLVLIDQHAADERITYERLREQLPRGEAQTLAEPVTIELTAGEAALFESSIDTLAGLGFYASRAAGGGNEADEANETDEADGTIETTGPTETTETNEADVASDRRIVEVRTVPAAIGDCDPELLRDVLAEFVSAERPGTTIDAAADALLADLACYPSITANTSLSAGSIVDLLGALDSCENPYACPHGRPVVIEFGSKEIADRFERDYPGHAGRRPE
jgi:DNA mismatch repair protein MutL